MTVTFSHCKKKRRAKACLFHLVGEAGLDYIFTFGENYRVAAVETGGKQMSTGHLHYDGFKSLAHLIKNKSTSVWMCFLFGGRGGT